MGLGEVNIKTGIFQRDSLSPLLFVITLFPLSTVLNTVQFVACGYKHQKHLPDYLLYMDDLKLYGKTPSKIESLLNTVYIYSQYIAMEFRLDKCVTLKQGKIVKTEGIKMPHENNMKRLDEDDYYKYLGILQADIKHTEVKKKTRGEYKDSEEVLKIQTQ
uniref:Reverse transcriptase domain-containing protein n=1 Tax=Micrurus lemniscatus lemniscatus TaxID=129467 RepID=A0A2D4HJM7_MICLE